MSRDWLLFFMAAAAVLVTASPARAQASVFPTPPPRPAFPVLDQYTDTFDYDAGPAPKAGLAGAQFRLWVPRGVMLRGVLVLIAGRGGDSRPMGADPAWQALAKKLQLGLATCRLAHPSENPFHYQMDPNGVTTALLEGAVNALLTRAKVPLHDPPLAFWGHSAGAAVSQNFASRRPDRVLAVVLLRSPWETGEAAPGKISVPTLLLVGKNDRPSWVMGALMHYQTARASGAPWTLALSPVEGHEFGKTEPLTFAFLSSVIPLRLPSPGNPALPKITPETSGWLGNPDTLETAPLARFKGDKREATWLPDEATAKAWRAYLRGE